MTNRITFDGDRQHLDEIVLDNATIHIEQMSTHGWNICIWHGGHDGPGDITIDCSDLILQECEGLEDLVTIRPPLLGCGKEWDHDGVHRCEDDHEGHDGPHRCECGAMVLNLGNGAALTYGASDDLVTPDTTPDIVALIRQSCDTVTLTGIIRAFPHATIAALDDDWLAIRQTKETA